MRVFRPHRGAWRALSSIAPLVAALAAPASAQDLFRNPTPSLATRSDAGVAAAVAQWDALRRSDALPFSAYANFLIAHPGWPGEAALRRNAERNLKPDEASPSLVTLYFARFPAEGAAGDLRLAEAYAALGKPGEAAIAARRAWTRGSLSSDDEARLLSRYAGALTQFDHEARMERLLWQRATSAAARQLPQTSLARQPAFAQRLALQQRSDEAVNAGLGSSDAGMIYDRATWLRATGQDQAARALLASPRMLTVRPLLPEKWFELLLSHARTAAGDGDWQSALNIARQLDDAYAPGVEVRDRPLGERDDYTSLAFLAGQAALIRLGRPAEAITLFERYARAARSPQTQSKGLYWAGRAAQASGQAALASSYYSRAAQFFDQFYGQLASERLGIRPSIPAVTRSIEISAAQRAAFDDREIVRAADLLGRRGDWTTQSLFVRQIASAAATDMDHVLAVELSRRLLRPDLAVMIGRSAGINGLRDYVRAGFPTVSVLPQDAPSWTIVHAISRQESQFDRKIVSRAGARGVMQLMPGTAREEAGKLGVAYAAGNLDDPAYNIELGASYFGRLMTRWGGNYVLAVASYNAGAGNVAKWVRDNGDPRTGTDVLQWIEAIPFTETRGYVQNVLTNAVVYDLLNPGRATMRGAAPLSAYLGKPTPG